MAPFLLSSYSQKNSMRNLLLALLAFGLTPLAFAQGLPHATVQTLEGKSIDAATLTNDGKPMVVSFWATWCKPCINELNAMAEHYEELHDETGVNLIAVSIDDSRTSPKVGPFVAGQGWDYTVVLDPNSDLRRAMGVNNVPHTFLLNAAGEVVWQANKYVPGEEEVLISEVRKLK
jgi:thiol-disulfide isomerase/thioredoxin